MTSFAADSPAVAHGMGLFETMLVVGGQVFDVDAHFARLAASALVLGFPVPEERAFRDAVTRAARKVLSGEAALRCLYVQDTDRWRLVATTSPIPATTLRRRNGARVITLDRGLSRALPQHKLTSYAPSIIGLQQAIAAGADEGLFVDRRGRVLEGTTTNVFAIDGSTLITARTGILPGIVRAWVLEDAARAGLDIAYRSPTFDELRNGSFLTSSLTTLAPITHLDGVRCQSAGAVFARLRKMWEHGRLSRKTPGRKTNC
jgi:branched-subunit amino acid aminotransferase/4-amino-4-deoxychorismate lyase